MHCTLLQWHVMPYYYAAWDAKKEAFLPFNSLREGRGDGWQRPAQMQRRRSMCVRCEQNARDNALVNIEIRTSCTSERFK